MSNPLPSWLERLFGIEAGSGEGTSWGLDGSWDLRPWVTLLLVVFAVAFVVATYLREGRDSSTVYRMVLAGIRLAAVGVVLFMIAQVVLSLQRTGLPYVAVLVDDSLSMGIVDRYEEPLGALLRERIQKAGFNDLSRWNLARTALVEDDAAVLRGIQENYKLRLYFLRGNRLSEAAGVEEIVADLKGSEAKGERTPLGAAVRTILDDLRGTPPAAVVMLTDGINTDGPPLADAAAQARRRGVPLYLVGVGDDRPVRDVRVSDLLVDEAVFVDDLVYFEVRLSATGYEGQQAQVVLREQGKREPLAKETVTLGANGQSQHVRLPYRPTKEGEFRYVVEAEPLAGEVQTDNNRREQTVRVRKEKVRVLLVCADPSFEFRYLENMLARDASIDLKTVLQNADLEHAQQDPRALRGFPVQREELFQYDVVILGDADPAGLAGPMMQNLVEFVDKPGKGGAIVCIAGPKYMPLAYRDTPLARLLPIDAGTARAPDPGLPITEGFRIRPTELGRLSPAMQIGSDPAESLTVWKDLPPVYWLLEAPDVRPGARVLAEHPTRQGRDGRPLPVIVMRYTGAGKVLFHATDETWRWRYRVGDVFFARYWVQTIRYLARSKLSEGDRAATLSTDRREYRRGEPVRLRVRFADESLAPPEDDGVTVVLEHPGHKSERLRLRRGSAGRGVFEGTLNEPAAGSYHALMAVPSSSGRVPATDFTVIAPPGEFERIETDSQEMQRAVEQTDGRYYTLATVDRLVEELPEGHQVPIESLPPKPLWNTWPVLLLLLALLVTEWVLRKIGGMA
jgi:hypothetical protein